MLPDRRNVHNCSEVVVDQAGEFIVQACGRYSDSRRQRGEQRAKGRERDKVGRVDRTEERFQCGLLSWKSAHGYRAGALIWFDCVATAGYMVKARRG